MLARERLDAGALSYYSSGADAQITLRENVLAWQRIRLAPRMLVDVSERDFSVQLLGKRRPNPLVVAPMAYQKLAHPDGETALAQAAAETGAIYTLSTLASTSAADVAASSPTAPRWFQLYFLNDRKLTNEIVEAALESGYEAIVVTVDLPLLGLRESDVRGGFEIDLDIPALRGSETGAPLRFADIAHDDHDPTITWKDLEELASRVDVPVLVKGVLRPDDARRAVDHGAAGVIVSNHGGRQLDTVLPTAEALPPIVAEVGNEVDVLVDGGISRGTDVLKALALGAKAVLLGRPLLWGLAVGGQAGAQRVIELVLEDLDRSLALVGCPRAELVDRDILVSRDNA